MPRKAQYEREKARRYFFRVCRMQGPDGVGSTSEERKVALDELGGGLSGEYRWSGLTFDELGLPIKPASQGTLSGIRNMRLAAERREKIRELCPDIWGDRRKIKKIADIARTHGIKVSVRTLYGDFQGLPKNTLQSKT